jgi:hypothetical protein
MRSEYDFAKERTKAGGDARAPECRPANSSPQGAIERSIERGVDNLSADSFLIGHRASPQELESTEDC